LPQFYETVFIGGGISCLSAASGFRGDAILFERADRVGGLCKSDQLAGFTFDRTGHLLHLRDPRVRRLVKRLLGDNIDELARNSWIYSHGVYTRYPFQSHFFGLPPEVVSECLLGMFAAHKKTNRYQPKNFAQWVMTRFGRGVARHFMFPYNQKLWTVSPRTLTTEWLGRFVPKPDLKEVIRGAVSDWHDDAGYNAKFFYPVKGGIETLVKAMTRPVKRIVCQVGVAKIDLKTRQLTLTTGDRVGFGRLVSCVALPALIKMIASKPDRIRKMATKLRWSSVYNLNIGFKDRGCDRHWVYVPENRWLPYRFGYASNFSKTMAPRGAGSLYTETAYSRTQRLDKETARRRIIRDLIAIGVLNSKKDILVEKVHDLKYAYAIYDRNRKRSVSGLLDYLETHEIYSIGRYGRWEYSAMEDAIIQGIDLAKYKL